MLVILKYHREVEVVLVYRITEKRKSCPEATQFVDLSVHLDVVF